MFTFIYTNTHIQCTLKQRHKHTLEKKLSKSLIITEVK